MVKKHEKIRLLLVDDETEFLESMAKALSRRGFRVFTATDGSVALRLLKGEQFDVAVLDIKMPGMPGDELFREIKRSLPMLPVIFLTGHGSVQQAFETSREGVFEYLTKPCDVEHLAEVVRSAAEARRSRHAVSREPGDVDVRLLFVDDEEEMLDSLSVALRRRGMRVVTASDAREALQRMREQLFDVALLDIKMPGIDGVGLARMIKNAYPTTEVIFLTGHPSVETAVEGFKEGAFDYITKPQDMGQLVDKILQACSRSRARRKKARKLEIERILEKQTE